MPLNVAVIFGGDSSEYVVSKKSGKVVYESLLDSEFKPYLVEITSKGWFSIDGEQKYPILKDDFTFIDSQGNKTRFAAVFNAIHGTPGEDGKIQGYFDLLGLPYNCSGVLASALTFEKSASSIYCAQLGYRVPRFVLIDHKRDYKNQAGSIVEQVGLPCFVKPNRGGSSFGASKVKTIDELSPAIDRALEQGSEVLVEEYIAGTEVTSGVINYKGKTIALPLTEIVPEAEFFDYKAKYEGASEEITPARISDELTKNIQEISTSLYDLLNLKGMIRADYIILNDNTIM